jgi:hypothetical protein
MTMKEMKLKVLGVRLSENQVTALKKQAEEKHLTLSTLGRVLFESYLRGDVKI